MFSLRWKSTLLFVSDQENLTDKGKFKPSENKILDMVPTLVYFTSSLPGLPRPSCVHTKSPPCPPLAAHGPRPSERPFPGGFFLTSAHGGRPPRPAPRVFVLTRGLFPRTAWSIDLSVSKNSPLRWASCVFGKSVSLIGLSLPTGRFSERPVRRPPDPTTKPSFIEVGASPLSFLKARFFLDIPSLPCLFPSDLRTRPSNRHQSAFGATARVSESRPTARF
jgi:hypothetical protein